MSAARAMIRYALSCDGGHRFESWFRSADAFAALAAGRNLACPVCGSPQVEKALMAPAVRLAGTGPADPAPPDAAADTNRAPKLAMPRTELETALAALRKHLAENSDYVGLDFVQEARAIHDGEAPSRAIHGEASPDEARKLIEDGVPVAPLPFIPGRKTH